MIPSQFKIAIITRNMILMLLHYYGTRRQEVQEIACKNGACRFGSSSVITVHKSNLIEEHYLQ